MSRPLIQIDNEVREMTASEYEQFLIDAETESARINAERNAKASAQAKLNALGLTDDEIKALVG
jgi:arginyl-tRNA--protein-N-Asp/Glu arginylyltransferase